MKASERLKAGMPCLTHSIIIYLLHPLQNTSNLAIAGKTNLKHLNFTPKLKPSEWMRTLKNLKMTIEYIRYKIPTETKNEFIKAYITAAESLRASTYCLGYELTEGNEEPENYILRIKWKSMHDHLEGFRKSTEFKTFFQAISPFFNQILEMKHYDFTEVYWSRSNG